MLNDATEIECGDQPGLCHMKSCVGINFIQNVCIKTVNMVWFHRQIKTFYQWVDKCWTDIKNRCLPQIVEVQSF